MKNRCAAIAALVVTMVTALAAPQALTAQESAAIRGTVTDAQTGEALAGAQVSIRGTGVGTITNNDGRYLLQNVPSGTVELRVEYIGFSPQQRTLTVVPGGTLTEDFQMGVTAIELEELVATGYAQQTRREVSSAISTVKAADVENTVVASLDGALQGKAAGVQVTQNAGNPGIGMTVRVRGSASISASNQPLYVVDGVPIFRENFSQLGSGGQDLSAITGLNPSEIESINILKDAAASAIYGSRGSNGVVMITTKRGSATAGAPRVTVNTSMGWQQASNTLDVLSADEWFEYMDRAFYNSYCLEEPVDPATCAAVGENYISGIYMVDEDGDGLSDIDTDWQDEVLRTAPVTNTQVSINGGNERFKYYLSGTYFDQEGIVIGSAYDRASGRVNLDLNATDRLQLAASLSLSQEDNDRISSDNSIESPIANSYANEPWAPVFDPATGEYSDWATYANPVAVAELNKQEARTLRSFGSFTANYSLLSWLRASGRAGFDFLQLRDYGYGSALVPDGTARGVGGYAEVGNAQARKYLLEGFFTGERIFGANQLSVTVGASTEQTDSEESYLYGEGFTSPELQWPANAAVPGEVDGTTWEHNLVSYFSRANYSFDDRFIVNASLRADGSSRFGENVRFGYFPAASLAWVVSNESFLQDLDLLSDLKVRGSWGVTGNEAIGNFQFLELYGSSNYGDLPGVAPQNLGNPDLQWERTEEWNVGFDGSFFEDRLGLVAEYYKKATDDLLLSRPVTATSGFTSVLANVGAIENRGWELSLRTVNLRPARKGGLEWTTTFNITHNVNEVTALAGDNEPFGAGFVNRVEVGQPLGFFYLPEFQGVDPATGDALYTDLEECGVGVALDSELCAGHAEGDMVAVGTTTSPGSNDRQFVGSPHPDYYGGLRNSLSWGIFDLNTFFEFSQGAEVYFGVRQYADAGGYYFDNKVAGVMDYWKQPGDVTDSPRPSWFGGSGAYHSSSRFVEDGSYIRLQEVTLGMQLPDAVNDLFQTSTARLYVSGKNLKTWTDYSGINPDVNSFGSGSSAALGTDFYSYPLARTLTIGFQGTW